MTVLKSRGKKKSCYACYQNSSFSVDVLWGNSSCFQACWKSVVATIMEITVITRWENKHFRHKKTKTKHESLSSGQLHLTVVTHPKRRRGRRGMLRARNGGKVLVWRADVTKSFDCTSWSGVCCGKQTRRRWSGGIPGKKEDAVCKKENATRTDTDTHTPPFFFSTSMWSRPLTAGLQIGLKRWQLRGRTRGGWKYSQRACRAKRSKPPTPRSCRDVVAKPWRAE